MSPVSTEVLDSDVKSLRDAVHAVDVRLGKLETRIGVYVGIFSFLGASILGCVGYGLIWYGAINTKSDQLSRDVAEIRMGLADVATEVKGLTRAIDRLSARIDAPPAKPGAE